MCPPLPAPPRGREGGIRSVLHTNVSSCLLENQAVRAGEEHAAGPQGHQRERARVRVCAAHDGGGGPENLSRSREGDAGALRLTADPRARRWSF